MLGCIQRSNSVKVIMSWWLSLSEWPPSVLAYSQAASCLGDRWSPAAPGQHPFSLAAPARREIPFSQWSYPRSPNRISLAWLGHLCIPEPMARPGGCSALTDMTIPGAPPKPHVLRVTEGGSPKEKWGAIPWKRNECWQNTTRVYTC